MRWLLVALVLFTSCAHPDSRLSTLWTNIPEIAGPVEQYNASQNDWQVLLEYHSDLSSALTGVGPFPDLVVGRSLASTKVKSTMASLDFLFDHGEVSKASFYRKLLESGSTGVDLKLLPLSFDLPILVYSLKQLPSLEPMNLTLERVEELSTTFNKQQSKIGLRLGFSPLWGPFPLQFLHLQDAAFGEDFQGGLTWDSPRLAVGLGRLSTWTQKQALGWEVQKEFTLKYLSTSPWPLVREGRILFYPSTLSEFLTLPYDERRGLDFRYLEIDGKIEASDNVLWAGIPSGAASRAAAEDFLVNFLRPGHQKTLALWTKSHEFRPFGITEGLSSLLETNTRVLPELYPELTDRIPEPGHILFWGSLPVEWPTLRDKVVQPWLATAPGAEKLPELLDAVTNYGKPAVKK